MTPQISIVSPVCNEAEGLAEFFHRVTTVMEPLGKPYELLLINDGSRDATLQIAQGLAQADPRVRVVSFSRNFGHEAASTAGLRYARGQAVVLIDSDLQDPPEIIPTMLQRWAEGHQMIYGVRKNRREDTLFRRATSWLFYRLMRRLTRIDIPRDTGDFRLMDRRVVDAFNALPERHRFVRGMFCWTGFRTTGVEFERAPRFAGKTKYNYLRLCKLALDSLTSFSTTPLRIATGLGALVAFGAMVWIVVVIIQYLTHPTGYRTPGLTFLAIAVLLLGGVQIFLMGILGEYLARTYEESQRRPLYIVDELVNFDDTPAVAGPNGGLLPKPKAGAEG